MSHWIFKSLLLVRTRLRRQYRQLKSEPTTVGIQLGLILLVAPVIVGTPPVPEMLWSEPGAYFYGTQLSAADSGETLEVARGMAGLVFLVTAYFVTFRMISNGRHLEEESQAILAAASPRTVAVSDMLTLIAYGTRVLGPLLLIGAASFGMGAGTFRPALTILFASTILVLMAVVSVYSTILALYLLTDTVVERTYNRSLVTVPAVLVMLTIFFEFRRSLSVLASLPIGWYADLALLGQIDGVSTVYAVLSLLSAPLIIGASVLAAGSFGEKLWLTETVRRNDSNRSKRNRLRGARRLERIVPRPVFAAVVMNWLRIRRQPRVFLYGGLLIVLTGSAGITAMRQYPESTPLLVAIYGAAAAGVGATLNPLGNEGHTLNAALTTPRGGKLLLIGYALAAAVPGGILVGLATFGTAMMTDLGTVTRVILGTLGLVLGFLSPFVSLGIGMALPKFVGVEPTGTTIGEIPRLEAVLVFLCSMVVIAIPAAFSLYDADTGGELSATLLAGPIATVLLGSAAGWLSFRYSVETIENLELSS